MFFPFDTETFPIRPGRQAPRVVCVQTPAGGIELRERGLDRVEAALHDPSVILYGHNVAFDALASIASRPRLLRPWFEAYKADRVRCTEVREKLIRIAQGTSFKYGKHGLVECLDRWKIPHGFLEGDKGEESWRLRYGELDGIPPEQWPEEARRYALADLAVEALHDAQEARREWLQDECRQARAAFYLALQSAHGMRTDARAVEAFAAKVEAENEDLRRVLVGGGIWFDSEGEAHEIVGGLVRPNGSRIEANARARMREVCRAQGLPVPLTKTGKEKLREDPDLDPQALAETYTALDADACKATGDKTLELYARFGSVKTLRSRADRLRRAGSLPIQPRFDVLKETGRTSSSAGKVKAGRPLSAFGDQVQNLNREPGLRECYTARPGHVLISVDWSAAELHTLAQCCIWLGLDSQLARILNSGKDAHMNFGAHMKSWSYEWAQEARKGKHGPEAAKAAKDARQGGKAANFGFPGGLGVTTFRLYAAKTYGLVLTHERAAELREWWLRLYPEMHDYFAHIDHLLDTDSPLVHFRSNRYRGSIRYTSGANSYFQGLASDMAKAACFQFAEECYVDSSSVLWGSRPWNFVHDEILGEVPEERAHECAMRLQEIMEEQGRVWCPDVPVRAEPAICRSWRKGAEPYYDSSGRLAPWEDRPIDPETEEKIRERLDSGADPIHVSWAFGFTEERIRSL